MLQALQIVNEHILHPDDQHHMIGTRNVIRLHWYLYHIQSSLLHNHHGKYGPYGIHVH